MKLKNAVQNETVERDGILFLKGHGHFGYSDGDRTEDYILNVIRRAKDISSESRELEMYIRNWATLYHLSRERALVYRSLNISPTAKVLEVGSGCGSITRLLGERADAVLALEGSPRRAAITRERTRDLHTVTVLCASFEDVVFREKFDLVVCNGVLEYAPLFVGHEEPHRHMIELLSGLVAPGGSMIVAIENKLGLRYFSSGKEEHTGIMFDGLEGYATRRRSPRTFGFWELHELLSARFQSVETFLPLPDYKLPVAIIRAELTERVNCAELFAGTARHDFETYVRPRMHERLVWHELQKNGLLREFANSFVMIAGDRTTTLFDPEWMGDIYSIRRKPEWTVRTRIFLDRDGCVYTSKSYCEPGTRGESNLPFRHSIGESRWVDGVSIHTEIVRALRREGAVGLETRLREPVLAWWRRVAQEAAADGSLPGTALDDHWQNAFLKDGKVEFVDREWIWRENIGAVELIYRVVSVFVAAEVFYVHRWSKSCRSLSPYHLMKAVGKIIGAELTMESLLRGAAVEAEFQAAATGRKRSKFVAFALIFEPIRARYMRYVFRRLFGAVRFKILVSIGRVLQAFVW